MHRWLLIVFGVSLLTGCGAIKNMLRPMVCDCEKEVACEEPRANSQSPIVQVNRNTEEAPEPDERDVTSSEAAALEAIDPSLPDATLDVASQKKSLKSKLTFEPLFAFKGDFSGKRGPDYVGADDDMVMFSNGKWRSQLPIDTLMRVDELKDPLYKPFAAQLVKDDALELVLFTVDSSDPAQRVYLMQVYKAIGERIGIVFEYAFARKTANGITPLAKIDFVEGAHHRRIRVTPVSPDGLLDLANIKVFAWNKWEGMFRVPRKPPTAP